MTLLEKFPVWKEYKDQKHDLFLSDKTVAGYLTGKILVVFMFMGSLIISDGVSQIKLGTSSKGGVYVL